MAIEGLRGLSAVLVALSHLLGLAILDPAWRPEPPLRFLEAGHAGVLIFFAISGYVIGLTNVAPFSPALRREYVKRRAIRLLPIYVAAWVLTLVISGGAPVRDAVANLFLLQNVDLWFGLSLPPLPLNPPAWSLHYEGVYYLGFILMWALRPPLWIHTSVALALTFAGWLIPHFPVFISGYACGWIFWSLGWHMSRQPFRADDIERNSVSLAAALLLLIGTHHFASGQIFLNGLGLSAPQNPGMVNLSNLSLLPACLLCIIAASRRRVPGQRLLTIAAFAIPLSTAALLLFLGRLGENSRWGVATGFICAACMLAPVKSLRWLAIFAPFGSISYGFYMVHYPLLHLVQRLPLPSGTSAGFTLRAVVWIALSVAAAWWLERNFQPVVRRFFLRPSTASA